MRKILLLTLIGLSILACSSGGDMEEEPSPTDGGNPQEEPEPQEEEEEEEIDVSGVTDFSVVITRPESNRDFTYHEQGSLGIFQNPNENLLIEAELSLSYEANTLPIPPGNINVSWHSDIDGLLAEGQPNGDYKSSILQPLSRNIHKVFIEASIGDEVLVARDTIVFSNVISLNLEPTDRSIRLNWSRYEFDDFTSYLVYRGAFEPIAEIFDQDILEYEDLDVVLAEETEYQVVVNTTSESEIPPGSNITEDTAGNLIEIDHYITKAIYDRTRNKIYALVGSKFNQVLNTAGLIIIDDSNEKLAIETHILRNLTFADLDMSPDGQFLFLCRKGTDAVTRLDLTTLQSVEFEFTSRGVGIHKIEAGNNNRVYGHENPVFGQPVHFFNGLTGEYLGSSASEGKGLVYGDIEFNHQNNKLYHGTSQRSKSVLRIGVENDMLDSEASFTPDINWPQPFILLSEDGQHVFWEFFELDTDLNLVRDFRDVFNNGNRIQAISEDSQYLSNGLGIINYGNLEYTLEYPNFPAFDFSGEIFTNDEIIIYKSRQPLTTQRFTYFFKIGRE